MLIAWTTFLLLGSVIAVAGFWLSRFGDVIAERTGLSGTWIGLVLIATVTSLPELVTGVSAVRVAGSPDLALGDVLGSCLFNLLLLSMVDAFYRPACLYARASEGHALSTGYAVVLLSTVGIDLLVPLSIPGPVSLSTFLIVPVYLLALRNIFTYERRRLLEPAEPALLRHPGTSLRRAVAGYLACAAAVVAAGVLLPGAALDLAEAMGWTSTFVGTLFLAAATSAPELVVTLSAVRIGALDMAIANLLGSNLFNMMVLVVDDLVYPGPLLADVSDAHSLTVMTAVLMSGIVTVGLVFRPTTRPAQAVSWVSLALIAAYGVNLLLLASSAGGGS
ncbi:sodium:calcium antiporter [Brevundimonas sp.]|uniref:sodium:calcium antiporter n=1 Tax=Brevundimonas sp. TaxID=1871086 RepID=UPI0035AFFB01